MRRARREEPEGGGGQRPLPVPQGAAGGGEGRHPPHPTRGVAWGVGTPTHTTHPPLHGGLPRSGGNAASTASAPDERPRAGAIFPKTEGFSGLA